MTWGPNVNYLFITFMTGLVTSIYGIYPENFTKSYLPERNVVFEKSRCNNDRSILEISLLHNANNFKPTYKELVVIIGQNNSDALDLAKFLTNGNQTISNKEIQNYLYEYYDEESKTAYYAHYGEFRENDYLVNRFLTKKVIDFAEKVKIILTSRIDGVEDIFKLAYKVVPNLLKYKKHTLLVANMEQINDETTKVGVSDELKEISRTNKNADEIATFLLNRKSFVELSSFNKESQNLVRRSLKELPFAVSNKTDFSYPQPINLEQEFIATCVVYDQPSGLITSSISVLGDMRTHFNNFMNENCNHTNVAQVRECAKTVERFYTCISSFREKPNFKRSHEFFTKIREIVQHLKFPLSESTSKLLYERNEPIYNYLFENAMPVILETDFWTSPFEYFLTDNLNAYKFYESFLELSDPSIFNLPISNQRRKNIQDLFIQIENLTLITNDKFHVKAFEVMKQTVYNKNVTVKCIPIEERRRKRKMEVRGDIVSTSYVNNNKCQNVTYIEIFALDTLVIDEDLHLRNERMEVGMSAPVWLVMGNRTVDLSGSDGKNWTNSADNGRTNGTKFGAHGKPGLPGESAGHFYGIAENIINSHNLVVKAAGGNGGAGQGGGNAAKGDDGKTCPTDKFNDGDAIPGWSTIIDKQYIRNLAYAPYRVIEQRIFGKPGQAGGRGGNGGIGGQEGMGGSIKVLQLGQYSDIMMKFLNPPGKMGAMGKGGEGGLGGVNGNTLHVEFSRGFKGAFDPVTTTILKTEDMGFATRGADGLTGSHFVGRKQPLPVQEVQSFARVVNNYKNYTRESFDTSVTNVKLERFYVLLNNHVEIVKSYGVLDLIEEFIDLERQFDTLTNTSLLFPSYENLLKRVEEVNDKMKEDNIQDEYETIPITSMLVYLKDKVDSNQEYGLNEAQFSIISEFKKLESLHMRNLRKADAAETFTSVLKLLINDIDDSIEEGRSILKTVQRKISEVESELDHNLESVVIDVITKRNNQSKAIEDLSKEFTRIQDGIQKKMLIGIGKTICQSLAFINPTVGAVGLAASSVLNIIEDTSKANVTNAFTLTTSITKALNSDFKAAEDLIAIKKAAVEKLIKEKESLIDETLEKLPENDNNTQALRKWKSLNDLDSIKSSEPLSLSFKTIISKTEAQEKELLEDEEKNMKKKYDVALKVIGKFKQTTKITEIFGDTGTAIVKDQALLKTVLEKIDTANKNFANLRKLEDDIYSTIVPVLDGIKGQLDLKNYDFGKISKIRLSLVKWQIKQQLETVKHRMESMLKGFQTNEEFIWTMEKLINAVDTFLQVEGQIKELEDEKKKQNLTLSLNINSREDIPQSWYVGDIHISRSFTVLNKLYQTNAFEKAYSEWLQAYKQFVFPYYKTIQNLPNVPLDFSDLKGLMLKMDNVKIVLEDHKNTNFPPERDTMNFVNRSSTTSPFYTWYREEYETEINRLLSGESVTFVANITNQLYNAVKLNKISIYFYGDEKTKITDDLEYFIISLTHLGDSYYRCNNNVFLMKNSPTTIKYRTDKISDYKGGSYHRLTNKDYVLSPYATWKIQLLKFKNSPKDFSYLINKYKGKVDLGLEGHGFFIDENKCECEKHCKLLTYYELV